MLRFLKNRYVLLIAATVLLFVVMGLSTSASSSINSVSNILSVPFTPLQRAISLAGQRIESFFSYFKDTKAIKQENEELKIKISELEKQNRELQTYKEKNEELREALKLKGRFDSYDFLGANVIAKDPGNWFNTFVIDVGKNDGVYTDCPVVNSSKGLVGRVISVDATSSKVLAIIDEDFTVSGWISKPNGGNVRVRGDLTLKDQGLCRMDYIPLDVDVAVDDVIETSGLGGIFPKGILIGTVAEVGKSSGDLSRYAIIEPAVDFKKLEEVFVLIKSEKSNSLGSEGQ